MFGLDGLIFVQVKPLVWGQDIPPPSDLIVCGDLLYTPKALPALMQTIIASACTEGAIVVFGFQVREPDAEAAFFDELQQNGFLVQVRQVDIAGVPDMQITTATRL